MTGNDDQPDGPLHAEEATMHLRKYAAVALVGIALVLVPYTLNWAGLLLGTAWAWPLWICQNLGMFVLLYAGARVALGPYGPWLSTTGRRARVPCSPEVQRHQERSGDC